MRKTGPHNREKGSVLIDTLVAVMVCAIVLGSLAPLFSRIIHLQTRLIGEVETIADSTKLLW